MTCPRCDDKALMHGCNFCGAPGYLAPPTPPPVRESAESRCRGHRRRILEVSQQVPAAHVAPAFSCVEIVDALYNEVMRPQDVFIMSKGHGCLAQYVVLENTRWPQDRVLSPRLLEGYCQPGGRLGAHPDYAPRLGIHASTGSLGHGLGIAAGQALAERMKDTDARVYVLLSDGECQEGSTWEAAMVAANLELHNLIILVDSNDFGGMDRMSEHHPAFYPLTDKFRAFGCAVDSRQPINGHDAAAVVRSVRSFHENDVGCIPVLAPGVVICRTTKGKGVYFMENSAIWHYRSPTPDEYQRALRELEDAA